MQINKTIISRILQGCPPGRYCHFSLVLGSNDSDGEGPDGDGDIVLVTGIQASTGNIYTLPAPIPLSDFASLEEALNALNIGTFAVTPVGDGGEVKIDTPENSTLVEEQAFLLYSIEGQNHELKFNSCDCVDVAGGDCDGDEKCDYTLFRQFVDSNGGQLRFKAIKFASEASPRSIEASPTNHAIASVDARNVQWITEWIRQQSPFGDTFSAYAINNGINLLFKKSKYGVEYVLWEIITEGVSGQNIRTHRTDFTKSGCILCCPAPCGGEGQLPCNNGQNEGCNNGLHLNNLDGLCYSNCKANVVYDSASGTWVAAGGQGQSPDCLGKCQGNLVATPYGCQPPSTKVSKCSYELNVTTKDAERLTKILFCKLGERVPNSPILMGDGTALATWLNDPATGLCPAGSTTNCITVTATAVPNSGLTDYTISITDTALGCTNANFKVETTQDFVCDGEEYCQCLTPTCADIDYVINCLAGQQHDSNWLKCTDVPQGTCVNLNVLFRCSRDATTAQTFGPYETVVNASIQEVRTTASLFAQAKNYADYHKISIDAVVQTMAVSRLISAGRIPENYRLCFASNTTGQQDVTI